MMSHWGQLTDFFLHICNNSHPLSKYEYSTCGVDDAQYQSKPAPCDCCLRRINIQTRGHFGHFCWPHGHIDWWVRLLAWVSFLLVFYSNHSCNMHWARGCTDRRTDVHRLCLMPPLWWRDTVWQHAYQVEATVVQPSTTAVTHYTGLVHNEFK